MLNFSQFEWLSFDCYGTLIDWESGILGYLRPLLQSKGCSLRDDQILNVYSEFEPLRQAGDYRTYRDVLAGVVRDFADGLDIQVTPAEVAGLAESLRNWQPFPDTIPALQALHSRYKLAILSNVDDDLFAYSAEKLHTRFDSVVTAEQAQGYKPSLKNFELLLERLAIPRSRLLHVAESLYHDVAPATALGLANVGVNRRQGRPAAASKLAAVTPDLEIPNLAALAELCDTNPRKL